MLTPAQKEGRFISILADGKFHESVPEGTENAEIRHWETKDGKSGDKHELVYSKIEAKIVNVAFHEGDFGENLQVTFADEGVEVTLSVGVGSNFGEDLMKKLPAIDFAEKVKLIPYAFDDENGKTKRGVTVYQNEAKVTDFFWDGDNQKKLHGFPPIDKKEDETWSKDEWKMYFLKARVFLVKYLKENIVPKFEGKGDEALTPIEYPVAPEDLPAF